MLFRSNNLPTWITTDHAAIARCYSLTEHMAPPEMVIMSAQAWDALGAAHKDAVASAAIDSRAFMRKLWDQWMALSRTQAIETGAKIITDVDKPAFVRAVAPIVEAIAPGPTRDFVERIRAQQ